MKKKKFLVATAIAILGCQLTGLTSAFCQEIPTSPTSPEQTAVGKQSSVEVETPAAEEPPQQMGEPGAKQIEGPQRVSKSDQLSGAIHAGAIALLEQAKKLSEAGNLEQANSSLKDALTILDNAKHSTKFCWGKTQVRSLYLKNLLRLNQFEDAAPVLEKLIAQLEFGSKNRDALSIKNERNFYADCLFDLGEAALIAGNTDLAVKHFKESLKHRRMMASEWGARRYPELDIFMSLCALGRAQQKAGNMGEASDAFVESHGLLKKLRLKNDTYWYAELADAIDQFEKVSSTKLGVKPELKTPYKFEPGSFQFSAWEISLRRADRAERDRGFQTTQELDRTHDLLEAEARTLPESDPRRILSDIQMAKYNRYIRSNQQAVDLHLKKALESLGEYAPDAINALISDWEVNLPPKAKAQLTKLQISVFEKQPKQHQRLKPLYISLLKYMTETNDYDFAEYYNQIAAAVEPDNSEFFAILPLLAERLESEGKTQDAKAIYAKIVAHDRKRHGANSMRLKKSLEEYARLLERTNDSASAKQVISEAAAIQ